MKVKTDEVTVLRLTSTADREVEIKASCNVWVVARMAASTAYQALVKV